MLEGSGWVQQEVVCTVRLQLKTKRPRSCPRNGRGSKSYTPTLIQDQLIVESCRTEVLEGTALDQEEYTMVQYINKNFDPDNL